MAQKNTDQKTARRRDAMRMFYVLIAGVVALVAALIWSNPFLPAGNDLVRGIVLTAIAGAISSLLSFAGLIVKGVVDNMTKDETEQ